MEDRTRMVVGGDGVLKEVPEPWWVERPLTADERTAAEQMLGAARAHQRPASEAEVEEWIITLGTVVASNLPTEEAEIKAMALARLVERVPIGVIRRKQTLRQAARRFKFLPTFQELDSFLSEEAAQYRKGMRRLEELLAGPRPAPVALPTHPAGRMIRDLSPEERDAFFAGLDEKYPGWRKGPAGRMAETCVQPEQSHAPEPADG